MTIVAQKNIVVGPGSERRAVYALLLIILINILKPVADYFLNISNASLTQLQLAIIFIAYFYLIKNKFRFKNYEQLLIAYLIFRYVVEVIISANIYQPSVSLVKFILLIVGTNIVLSNSFSKIFRDRISLILWSYLFITTIISLIQQSNTFLSNIFMNYGGNIVSSNGLGIDRATGGIGGTVIDYSFFIGFFLMILISPSERVSLKKVAIFFISALLCFSRIIILQIFLILIISIFVVKNIMYKIFMSLTFILLCYLLTEHWAGFINLFEIFVNTSDQDRVHGWSAVSNNPSVVDKLIGNSMGLNTGFPADGQQKITADGHFIGFFSDFGILGLGIYIIYLYENLKRLKLNRNKFYLLIIIFAAPLFINSGFDKIFNVMMFPFVLLLIKKDEAVYKSSLNK